MAFHRVNKKDMHHLDWLVEDVRAARVNCPKTIVYVTTRKGCTAVMLYFKYKLKAAFYTTTGTPIVEVFNAASSDDSKAFYQSEFEKNKGTMKVLICTTAFGLGIDIPDVERVVH